MYDFYILTNKKFIMNSTNFNNGDELIMSYETTPELSVFTALRMSSAIPLIYVPILYNDNYYLDGALSNSILLNHCNYNTTIGFFIETIKNFKLDSISELINGSLIILSNKINYDISKYKIIKIKLEIIKFTKLDILANDIKKIFTKGKKYAELFYINELKNEISKINKCINTKIELTVNVVMNKIIEEIEFNSNK